MNKKELSASVLVFVEDVDDKHIESCLNNIKSQTYKNIEVIISSFKTNNSPEIVNLSHDLFLNCRWIHHTSSKTFINEALELSTGDIVFYRTINNVYWFPRHIEAHMDLFKRERNLQWSLSHIEMKDMNKAHIPFNTTSYRINNPPKIEQIIIDEICHSNNLKTEWSECIVEKENIEGFVAGYIVQQWHTQNARGAIPAEMTVVQWVEVEDKNKKTAEEYYKEISQKMGTPLRIDKEEETIIDDDGNIVIKRKLPTIVGNSIFEDHNQKIRNIVGDPLDVKSVGIKRTMGMGDVILCEPIIKKLREKFPNAEINFYTNKDEIVEYFSNKPDNTILIPETELLNDYLSKTNNDVSFDLDLSYESRIQKSFIESYIDVVDVYFDNKKDINPSLCIEEERLIEEKYVVVCGDHSGWLGKLWPLSKYENVIDFLQNKGYKVIETGSHHTIDTPSEYHDCDFEVMLNLIKNCEFYIGADNGPMHIARSFNKPCIAINGAALTYLSNPNKENILYIQDSGNINVGIKHKKFFDLNPNNGGITFVPIVQDNHDCGLNNIEPHHVIEAINKIIDPNYVFESFTKEADNIDNMKCLQDENSITIINL